MPKWFERWILEKKSTTYCGLTGLSLSLAACGGSIPPEGIYKASFAARSEAPLQLKDFRNWAWTCHTSHKTANILPFDMGLSISDLGKSASGRYVLSTHVVGSDCALYTGSYAKVDYLIGKFGLIMNDYAVENGSRLSALAKQFVEDVCDGRSQVTRPQELDCGALKDEEASRLILLPISHWGLRATDDNLNPSYFVFYRGSLINLTKNKG